MSIPNSELEHLIECYYGQIKGEIEHEQETLKIKGKTFLINSTTIVANVTFKSVKTIETFYSF